MGFYSKKYEVLTYNSFGIQICDLLGNPVFVFEAWEWVRSSGAGGETESQGWASRVYCSLILEVAFGFLMTWNLVIAHAGTIELFEHLQKNNIFKISYKQDKVLG